ncbi:AMP-binding protein [Roseivirga spongicola]|uniref:AMP-binding protein n=1 Tax=Roseivirga spongicola TaxID=333140 RepID=UPI000ACD06FD|nr:AMP-binding protein [Roseivirga spongicola]
MEGTIIINTESYTFSEFTTITLPKGLDWASNTQAFIKDWLKGKLSFTLQTSGSTGKPKNIDILRAQMIASAEATIQHLNIPTGASALLCMNPDMVGGRMMLVRALIGNWQLHILPASSSPIIPNALDFTAMVPLQVLELMKSAEGVSFLNRIDQLIIGGAKVDEDLLDKLQLLKTKVYQTFGMTETVSHIALKRINGDNRVNSYQLIGDNQIKVDEHGRLKVKGTVTKNQWIETNDLVESTENGFHWLGRLDLVVNSGGVKISVEPLEKELSKYFNTSVWVWKVPNEKLGEQLVGLTESQELIDKVNNSYHTLKDEFKKYHLPKRWVLVRKWCFTASGKPDRQETLLANS